jgi:hypothetical protein
MRLFFGRSLEGEEVRNLLLSDVFAKDGEVRRLYCDGCGQSMDLAFPDFSEAPSMIAAGGAAPATCPAMRWSIPARKSAGALIEA